jgi:hypothetical protein
MVPHPGEPLDDDGDALKGPQLADKPIGAGALQQGPLDLAELGVRQPWRGTGRPAAAQGVDAAALPASLPVADALPGDPKLAGNLGLADTSGQ